MDDLADLGHTIDQEHTVWTTRSNRMVISWMDGQKSVRTSTWNQGVKNGVRLGASWTLQIRNTITGRSTQLVDGVENTSERGG